MYLQLRRLPSNEKRLKRCRRSSQHREPGRSTLLAHVEELYGGARNTPAGAG